MKEQGIEDMEEIVRAAWYSRLLLGVIDNNDEIPKLPSEKPQSQFEVMP